VSRPLHLLLVLALALGSAGALCRPTVPGVVTGDPPKGFHDSAVGPGDVFEVQVFGEKDLTGTYRVQGDGSILYPLIGKVKVSGLTPPAIAHQIARRLRRGFLRNPQVTVFVKEYNSKKITVFGQVQKPGIYLYKDNMTIIQAITTAGGFTELADQNGTIVTRFKDGRKHRVPVKVQDIGEGRAQNFMLRPGDVVFVPKRLM
jgi:polysaccharide export outer membrane protein